MVFSRFHWRKPVEPRDPVGDPVTGAISMEQIVKAYLAGTPIDIPEPQDGDFEFPASELGENERYRDISRDELRSDDISPISVKAVDFAVNNSELFKSAVDGEPDSGAPEQPVEEPVKDGE